MTQQIRAIAAILFSILIFVIGNGLLSTLIPVRGDLAGFSDLAIGVIGSAYYAGFVIGCFMAPRMLARIGHIRTFAVAGGLAAAAVLAAIDAGRGERCGGCRASPSASRRPASTP